MTWLTPEVARVILAYPAGVYTVAGALFVAEVVHVWRTGEDRS